MFTSPWRGLFSRFLRPNRLDRRDHHATSGRRPLGRLEQLEPRRLLSGGMIALGPQTGYYDQPYLEIELTDGATGLGPYDSGFDIYPYRRLLMDTGANSMLVVSDASKELAANGLVVEGDYHEMGVAGYSEFGISQALGLTYRGTDGVPHSLPQTADGVRIMTQPNIDLAGAPAAFGGIPGIVGMPVMVDRVTTLDMSTWSEATDIFDMQPLGVTFADTLAPGDGHRYSAPLVDGPKFYAADGLPPGSPPDAPLPVWAHLPYLNVVAEHQGRRASGNFLLDTGAQLSFISSAMAFDLGLDEDGDGTFEAEKLWSIAVGGVGGTLEAPMLVIDKIRLPTEQGPDLVWQIGDPTNPEDIGIGVLVLDIAGIDGILGVDLLTSGLDFLVDMATLNIVINGVPYFDKLHFDFRDMETNSGKVYFDVSPEYDQVTPEVGVKILTGSALHVTEGGSTSVYELTLDTAPAEDVVISLENTDGQVTAVDDANPASAFLTFTPTNWNVPQTVRVSAVDDAINEGPHAGHVRHVVTSDDLAYDGLAVDQVSVMITDNDISPGVTITETDGSTDVVEAGDDDFYSIVLDRRPTAAVTVQLHSEYGEVTAVDQANPSNDFLVFLPNDWDQPHGVRVSAIDDDVIESVQPHADVITHTISISGADYQNVVVASVDVAVTDDDAQPGVRITQTDGSTDATENGSTDSYTVVLSSQPTGSVTVFMSDPDLDFQVMGVDDANWANAYLTFGESNWSTPQVVRVLAIEDDLVEGVHSGVITHEVYSFDDDYQGIVVPPVEVTLMDDDGPPGVTITQTDGSTSVRENGAGDTYFVVLDSSPTAAVQILMIDWSFQVAGLDDANPENVDLMFGPLNWSTPQVVRVEAFDDDLEEGLHSATITHTVISSDADYTGITVEDVVVTVTDTPTVAGVFFRGSEWRTTFLDELDRQGHGNGNGGGNGDGHATISRLGFGNPTGNGSQLDVMPWSSVNQISVVFDREMIVEADDLTVLGVNTSTYALNDAAFTYDPVTYTATWSLVASFSADKLLLLLDSDSTSGVRSPSGMALDGEWVNPTDTTSITGDTFPSGDGTAGGDFAFRANMHPGDVNGDQRITFSDFFTIRARLGQSPGEPGYNVIHDLNGDARITFSDAFLSRARLGLRLPTGEPALPPAQPPAPLVDYVLAAPLQPRRHSAGLAAPRTRSVAQLWQEDVDEVMQQTHTRPTRVSGPVVEYLLGQPHELDDLRLASDHPETTLVGESPSWSSLIDGILGDKECRSD